MWVNALSHALPLKTAALGGISSYPAFTRAGPVGHLAPALVPSPREALSTSLPWCSSTFSSMAVRPGFPLQSGHSSIDSEIGVHKLESLKAGLSVQYGHTQRGHPSEPPQAHPPPYTTTAAPQTLWKQKSQEERPSWLVAA